MGKRLVALCKLGGRGVHGKERPLFIQMSKLILHQSPFQPLHFSFDLYSFCVMGRGECVGGEGRQLFHSCFQSLPWFSFQLDFHLVSDSCMTATVSSLSWRRNCETVHLVRFLQGSTFLFECSHHTGTKRIFLGTSCHNEISGGTVEVQYEA